jgi:D-alanine-D-alanine ligase
MRGTIVGVLRGGPSEEHEVSLRSGSTILANLPTDRFTVRDIYIDRKGVWHEHGRPTTPEKVLRTIDVAVIALHGHYGENGEIQRLLDMYGVAYTGGDPFASFVSMHKVLTKEKAKEIGLKTPAYRFVDRKEDIDKVVTDAIRSFHQPVVVKPNAWGSSAGISIVGGYAPVHAAVTGLFERGATGVLIEERITGIEATAGVVEGLRGERLYALPPVEIVPPQHAGFFSEEVKYNGQTREIVPGRFTPAVTKELMESAQAIHEALRLRHYSRSDFIVSPKGIYFLETNSAPAVGMTSESLFPKSLAATWRVQNEHRSSKNVRPYC